VGSIPTAGKRTAISYVDVCDMKKVYADCTVKGISANDDGTLVGVGGFGECRLYKSINELIH